MIKQKKRSNWISSEPRELKIGGFMKSKSNFLPLMMSLAMGVLSTHGAQASSQGMHGADSGAEFRVDLNRKAEHRRGVRIIRNQADVEFPGSRDPEIVEAFLLREILGGGELLGRVSLKPGNRRESATGGYSIRYSQEIDNIPVMGAFVVIRYNRYDELVSIWDGLVNMPIDSSRTDVPVDAAVAAAKADQPDRAHSLTGTVKGQAFIPTEAGLRLAWKVSLFDENDIAGKSISFVDTTTSEILIDYPVVQHNLPEQEVYSSDGGDNFDLVTYTQTLLIDQSSGFNSNDQGANSYLTKMGNVLDFYVQNFNRDSIDDNGSKIQSTLYWGTTFPNNAYWDGDLEFLVFGSGNGNPSYNYHLIQDIVAHEFTHGVVDYDSGFEGNPGGEVGGLSEGIADLFGAGVDAHIEGVNADSVWMHHTYTVFENEQESTYAMRYLNDPAESGGYDSWHEIGAGSNHKIAGVLTLAINLLAEGGVHPRDETSVVVGIAGTNQGIGLDVALAFLYDAIPGFSLSTTFRDFRIMMADVAEAYDVSNGTDYESVVQEAFDAVEVPPENPIPDAPATITASSRFCFGQYGVSWATSEFAVSYDLRFSYDSVIDNDDSPLYTGSATSTTVNIPSNGYLGVRACNLDGACSGFTKTGYLQRASGCW